jgi:hypothetical protein
MRAIAIVLVLCALPAHAGTLDTFADQIAAQVSARGDLAVAARAREPALARLADTVEGLVVARLPRARALRAGAEAARREGFEAFIDLELAIDGGEVVAAGRVIVTDRNLWRAAAGAEGDGIAASFVIRARLDAELRAYLGGGGPTPVAKRERRMIFHPLRGTLDLGAPLLALALVGPPGQLVALTPDQVVLLQLGADGATVVARHALEGPTPVPRPRTPVGTLAIAAGGQIVARSSEHTIGATLSLAAGTLVKAGDARDYPLCEGAAASLVGSTAVFADAAGNRFLASGCGAGLTGTVDAAGTLRLLRPGDKAAWSVVSGAGTAFALADVDADGTPELAAAAYRAPGTGDVLTIYRLGADGAARAARRGTAVAGGVAALAGGDLDGDGVADVVAAVRSADAAPRYELWLLE